MAGPFAFRSSRRNLLLVGKDELAGTASTESSSTPTPTLAVSPAPTPALAIALSSDNKLFKQFIKAHLKA